jgi:hypothetical protein
MAAITLGAGTRGLPNDLYFVLAGQGDHVVEAVYQSVSRDDEAIRTGIRGDLQKMVDL